MKKVIQFFLEKKVFTIILLIVILIWGLVSSPFFKGNSFLPSNSVAVDAIPDIGENQQIVYTEWAGQSPQDIEDQVSYPLTTALLGIPGVKTIRSNSIFGLSSIYIIFEDNVDFYWSRTRILEKLNSLPSGLLPSDVKPALGPDATALGQIYWYTLEGRDSKGNPIGGWDSHELRSIQDFYVKYALTSSKGVSEVASIGGYIKEYQVIVDPNAMKLNNVSIFQILNAVKKSNKDIGARTLELNRVEYLIRAVGYIKSLQDLENTVVAIHNKVPIFIKDVAQVTYGPMSRRGGLDKGGAEAVGGVVVARYGSNPLEVINNVKDKIKEISDGLPSKTLENGDVSKVTIVPFYDRTGLINETLGTLEEALSLELLISILVIILLVLNLRASILISTLLPLGVLMTFIAMRYFNVDANIVALSGIAISIGVMVDVGVVFTENIIRHMQLVENKSRKLLKVIYEATVEVAPAVLTAITTTVVSFLPVFAMQASEGKLFRPLAFTKTFAMVSALLIGIAFIPTLANIIFSLKIKREKYKFWTSILLLILGLTLFFFDQVVFPIVVVGIALNLIFNGWSIQNGNTRFVSSKLQYLKNKIVIFYQHYQPSNKINIFWIALFVIVLLTQQWMPLGVEVFMGVNVIFVSVMVLIILSVMFLVTRFYVHILSWALRHKKTFLSFPIMIILFGLLVWQGINNTLFFVPNSLKNTDVWKSLSVTFPGMGKEFMPSLNEGSFLLMPTTMPHSGVEENVEVIQLLDKRLNAIPEVESAVGKWGRVNSALDPAPISMFENVINYKSEYVLNAKGHRERFKINSKGAFILKDSTTYNPSKESYRSINTNLLIQDAKGKYFRQWRPNIKSPDDIWQEIVKQTRIPGLTSAPKLQPIQTRLVMLQTGMRAPMGIKVYGPDLETIEKVGYQLENLLKEVDGVEAQSVFADRVVGKPYLEIHLDRISIARYGLSVDAVQTILTSVVGGKKITTTLEGRERYPVSVRYARDYRNSPEKIDNVFISTPIGKEVPLSELAKITYAKGPQMIKSEDTFLVGYVIFDKEDGYSEVNVVENAQKYIQESNFSLPAGVSYKFTGNYENQQRANKRLMIVIPFSLLIIFLILYFQFSSITAASLVFSGIFVAFSGGFIMLWLYAQTWFLNFSVLGVNLQDLFQIHTINLSVAVWVGFIALFGIATDDGVLISTYLKQLFDKKQPNNVEEIRATVIEAGSKRVRPAMMTTATTLIALLPVLSSTGKGSDIMVPMAIPSFGGMTIAILTIFVVPVLYSFWKESQIKK